MNAPAMPSWSGRLAEFLRRQRLIDCPDVAVVRLTGGQSNPTYRIVAGNRSYVLRMKPPGPLLKSAHAIDREYRMLGSLAGTDVPVPRAYVYCDDLSVTGREFYIMEFLNGRSWLDPALPDVDAAGRAAIYAEMNRVLATLHQVDCDAVGLGDFGRKENYFKRQIDRWSRQVRASRTRPIAALDALMEWLPANVPPGERTSIVHGDYRLDNLIFHPTQPRVLGIVDWELSTLGHPFADFSYNCLAWHIPATLWRGLGGLDVEALGIPDERSYVRRYARAMGQQDIDHWGFYLAYNLFRLAAIMQGVANRALEGNAVAADAVETGNKAEPLAQIGWQLARRYDAATSG